MTKEQAMIHTLAKENDELKAEMSVKSKKSYGIER
jgi:hypothetical protein